MKPRREYMIRLRHDTGHWTVTVGHHSDPRDAVAFLLADQLAPQRAVVWVKQRPVCDYCDQPATRYVRDSGEGTPLCKGHATEHYGTSREVRAATGLLGVTRFLEVPMSEWAAV